MNKLINKSTKSDIKMRHFCSVPNVSNLIYPPKCGVCGKLSEDFLCKKCRKMLENEGKFKIEKVFYEEKNFNEHMYFFKYEGIIRRLILSYKFKENTKSNFEVFLKDTKQAGFVPMETFAIKKDNHYYEVTYQIEGNNFKHHYQVEWQEI